MTEDYKHKMLKKKKKTIIKHKEIDNKKDLKRKSI